MRNDKKTRMLQIEPVGYLAVGDNVHVANPGGKFFDGSQRVLKLAIVLEAARGKVIFRGFHV